MTDAALDAPLQTELLAYRAPWFEEKLTRDAVASSRAEAGQLLQEVKKYLLLARSQRAYEIPMFSRRVDEAWHEFALFTEEYEAFCVRFFGELIMHSPYLHGAPVAARPRMSFEEFRSAYEPRFGPISSAWRDELALTTETRVIRVTFGKPIFVQAEGDKVALVWSLSPPRTLIRAGRVARAALQFLVDCDHFYVRELPGLTDEERVRLCRPLVKGEMLRVAP